MMDDEISQIPIDPLDIILVEATKLGRGVWVPVDEKWVPAGIAGCIEEEKPYE